MKLPTSVCGVVTALTLACLAADQGGGASDPKDRESLQGTWQVVSFETTARAVHTRAAESQEDRSEAKRRWA